MAPVLWLPIFFVMTYILIWTKTLLYFSSSPLMTQLKSNLVLVKPNNWMW